MSHLTRRRKCAGEPGFTLVEAMILLVVLSIIAVAVATSLSAVSRTPGQTDDLLAISNTMVGEMEALRATSFTGLATGTTTSTVTINNKTYTMTVAVSLYDANGDSTPETDCKQISVSISNQTLQTLVVQP